MDPTHQSTVHCSPFLPNELLDIVAQHADTYTLYNMCLASRTLFRSAQPILYSTYKQPEYHADRLKCLVPHYQSMSTPRHIEQVKYRSIRPFLRTILSRPDLGKRVQTLTIYNHSWTMMEEITSTHCIWKYGQDREIRRIIEGIWGEYQPVPTKAERHREVLLLCMLCPNIRRFDSKQLIRNNFFEDLSILLNASINNAPSTALASSPRFLPCLRALRLTRLGHLEHCYPLFSQPTLKTLFIDSGCRAGSWLTAQSFGDNIDNSGRTKASLSITNLTLKCRDPQRLIISQLIPMFPNLKRLGWSDDNWRALGKTTDFVRDDVDKRYVDSLVGLLCSLNAARHTLEDLFYDVEPPRVRPLHRSLPSLSTMFTKLRVIHVWQRAVIDKKADAASDILAKTLPVSLERLVLAEADLSVVPHLWALREHCDKKFKDLKHVGLDSVTWGRITLGPEIYGWQDPTDWFGTSDVTARHEQLMDLRYGMDMVGIQTAFRIPNVAHAAMWLTL